MFKNGTDTTTSRVTITESKAESLRKKAIEIVEQNTKSVLALAEVLWETWTCDVKVGGVETALWVAWGHKDWFQYVEIELGIHMTTASIYRKMHEVYNLNLKDTIDSELMQGMSVTKLRILSRVVDKKNVNSWLRKAAKLSCCALEEEVLHDVNGSGRPGAVHTMSVLCTKSEQKKIRNIIQQAQADMKLDRPGKTLMAILEEWENIRNKTRRARAAG